jgi:predicted dinucleotide-binding enzyme
MKITTIGRGNIGGGLADRWERAGHTVTRLGREGGDASDADVVLVAVPGGSIAEALGKVSGLDGKVVIDATNNVGAPTINSLGVLAQAAPSARLYRAFNSLGWENFADGHYGELTGDMLYSGPTDAKDTVEELIGATDLRPIWVGDNDKAKVVDDFVTLWFTLAFERGLGRNVGFKTLPP